MTRFARKVTTGSVRAATYARQLDDLADEWLSSVAHTPGVKAAGRRAAHALVTVSGYDPATIRPVLTVASNPGGVAHAAGVDRPDVVRGLSELREARLVVEDEGVLVLIGAGR